jgi:DNA-binding NarL/FixJ family response regulator
MRLATTPPDEDGPVWMVNLMKYREVGDYTDGRTEQISGARPTTATRRSAPSPPSGPKSCSPAIVAALLQGKRTATIAREMFISASTVRSHLSSIFRAFGVRSQADLISLLRSPADER